MGLPREIVLEAPHGVIADPGRLAELRESGFLDPERAAGICDRYSRLVARLLGAPIAIVSLVEHDRQTFAGSVGLPDGLNDTPLDHSFCQWVVSGDGSLVVADALKHPLLKDNLAIPDLGVRAYVGVPIRSGRGIPLGSLCAIDGKARDWTEADVQTLRDLVIGLVAELELSGLRQNA